jgi:Na+:H+ antiporter, NhaA family
MSFIADFIKKESSSGIVLIIVTIFALFIANSNLSYIYETIIHKDFHITLFNNIFHASILHFTNDGLMAIFFLLIGLEIKRELIEGGLSSKEKCILPTVAALGGMVVPAIIFYLFNSHDIEAIKGWAIPMATDIAFALGILSLLGKRVPVTLKIFLMALAILDDLGAILIIAIFYSANISFLYLALSGMIVIILILLNKFNVLKKSPYLILGVVLWYFVLKSGIHATFAGVILAFTIPLNSISKEGKSISIAKEIEGRLHYWVAFFIIPVFAFVNAGLTLKMSLIQNITQPMPLGIIIGLFIGKQIGVFGFSFIAIKLKFSKLPKGTNWIQFYGVCVLTGIGFTMSIFIALLSYPPNLYNSLDLLAIFVGSVLSGLIGWVILFFGKKKIISNNS